jgi:hypothetical protein
MQDSSDKLNSLFLSFQAQEVANEELAKELSAKIKIKQAIEEEIETLENDNQKIENELYYAKNVS